MAVEESLNKTLYRLELYLIKIIPIILAGITLLNTILSYVGIDTPILSYIGGISFFILGFLYLTSYVFRFCSWHRMALHYVLVINLLNTYDYYIGIPVSDYFLLKIHLTITGIFLLLTLYFKFNANGIKAHYSKGT